jgi:hypothetical protein
MSLWVGPHVQKDILSISVTEADIMLYGLKLISKAQTS